MADSSSTFIPENFDPSSKTASEHNGGTISPLTRDSASNVRPEPSFADPSDEHTNGTHKSARRSLRDLIPDPAPSLQNSGSVARDHLANERTWLAYLRTSLAIASAGVAAATEDTNSPVQIQRFARPLGGISIALAVVVLIIGAYRYFRIQNALIVGQFPPAHASMAFMSALLMSIIIIVFGVLVAVRQV
ncbi:hypothetical protein DL93DRAFT_2166611 [Clavulina sp. PMI_390]|nr:hypothetical protein DL93DRAFT_2166611 [Clavulina sp. PMI_390]